eukprot:s293_g3.t1
MGSSTPAQIFMLPAGNLSHRVELSACMTMPRERLILFSDVMGGLLLPTSMFVSIRDNQVVLALCTFGPVLIARRPNMRTCDVIDFLKLEFDSRHMCCADMLGFPLDDGIPCPDAVVLLPKRGLQPMSTTCLLELDVGGERMCVTFNGMPGDLASFLELLCSSGIHDLMQCMGWTFVVPISHIRSHGFELMQLVKVPGTFAIESDDALHCLAVLLFILEFGTIQSIGDFLPYLVLEVFALDRDESERALKLALLTWTSLSNVDLSACASLRMTTQGHLMYINGDFKCLMRLIQSFQQTRLEFVIDKTGWLTTIQFQDFSNPVKGRIVFIPNPNMDSISQKLLYTFLKAAMVVMRLPRGVHENDDTVFTKIKVWGYTAFVGWLPKTTLAETLLEPWSFADSILGIPTPMRAVGFSGTLNPDYRLWDYAKRDSQNKLCLTVRYVAGLRGGGPSKPSAQDITKARNSLATFFLGQGADIQDTSPYIDKLLAATSPSTIESLLKPKAVKQKWEGISKISKALNLSIPDIASSVSPQRAKVQDRIRKPARDFTVALNLGGIRVKDGFILNEDKSKCLQRDDVDSKGDRVQIPAFSAEGEPLVLSGCLHNLGKKQVQTSKVETNILTPDSVVVSFTACRDDLPDGKWKEITAAPVKTVLGLCCDDLQSFMQASGAKAIYTAAKNEEKQLSSDYQVVWLPQISLVNLRVTCASYPHHRGLVRSMRSEDKITRGIRFRREDFKTAFSELRPQDVVPSDIPPKHLFKISPVPIGASAENVQTWLDSLAWKARPMRLLASSVWLRAASETYDSQFEMWDSQPILIKWIQNRGPADKVVVAGNTARIAPAKQPLALQGSSMQYDDPWAFWNPSRAASSAPMGSAPIPLAAVRKLEAPIEDKFTKQATE